MKPTVLIIFLVLALIVTIYIMIDSLPATNKNRQTEITKLIIIDHVESNTKNLPVSAEIGQSLFRDYCAACHNRNMKNDMTGPALKDFFGSWDNDTLKVLEYLRNPIQYFKTNPSKRMIDLHRVFGWTDKPSMPDLTLDQVKSIIEYIGMSY